MITMYIWIINEKFWLFIAYILAIFLASFLRFFVAIFWNGEQKFDGEVTWRGHERQAGPRVAS